MNPVHGRAAPFMLAIAVGAFLLFLIQPIQGKVLLPIFGGGGSVWTTCLLFFQVVLLLGYAYAHAISAWLAPSRQIVLHSILLLLSLPWVSMLPDPSWRPEDSDLPTLRILLFLARGIGFPLLLLASTGPLVQRWFAHRFPLASPYRLYALSNLASLLGLMAYPFVLEPLSGLRQQARFWMVGYGIYVAACVGCGVLVYRLPRPASRDRGTGPSGFPFRRRVLCLALSACGTLLLMSTTNQVTQDIAPVPLLWVLPLALYLLSLIISFDHERWYDRRFWLPFLGLGLVGTVTAVLAENDLHIVLQVAFSLTTLFSACMVCHGELVRLKPDVQYLTSFYLTVAAGGALGGLFVAVLAPVLFRGYWEHPIGLVSTVLLLSLCLLGDADPRLRRGRVPWAAASALAGAAVLGAFLLIHVRLELGRPILATRSFYGILSVYEKGRKGTSRHRRVLRHGRAPHGVQLLDPKLQHLPGGYYGPQSGIAVASLYHPRRTAEDAGLNIGAVGLGAGTIAAHARHGDRVRFYEINLDVERIARSLFTYLENSPAPCHVVIGDARVVLERELREGSQQFDVLVLDAFNSDSIPVHLMTREAFELYFRHLREDGILALHISAIHLDLKPVVEGLADVLGKHTVRIVEETDPAGGVLWSEWILVTSSNAFVQDPRVIAAATPSRPTTRVVWTDDFSNLLQVVRY